MDIKLLKDIPPWEWPKDAGRMFLEILNSDKADESDRLLAAELAGDFTVINDELVDALLSILSNRDEPELLQGQAVISLGPILEHFHTDQAVCAAGNWEVSAAWSHIKGLVTPEDTEKSLLLAAIGALACIRPQEARDILVDLTTLNDEDIVEAAYEAMAMSGVLLDEDYDDEEDEFIH